MAQAVRAQEAARRPIRVLVGEEDLITSSEVLEDQVSGCLLGWGCSYVDF